MVAQAAVPSLSSSRVRVAVALAMVLVSTSGARAEPLLARSGGMPAALPGVEQATRLTLSRPALAALRAEGGPTRVESFESFPLGASRAVTLELRRFAPVGPHTRVDVMESDGPRRIAMPDAAYFTGAVAGEPGSRALVVATADAVHGFVASGGDVATRIGSAGSASWTWDPGAAAPGPARPEPRQSASGLRSAKTNPSRASIAPGRTAIGRASIGPPATKV